MVRLCWYARFFTPGQYLLAFIFIIQDKSRDLEFSWPDVLFCFVLFGLVWFFVCLFVCFCFVFCLFCFVFVLIFWFVLFFCLLWVFCFVCLLFLFVCFSFFHSHTYLLSWATPITLNKCEICTHCTLGQEK